MNPIQDYSSSTTSSTRLDIGRLLLERFYERRQFNQDLERQCSFGSQLTQACPRNRQADRAQWPAFAYVQESFRTLALKENAQALALQRVEWVGNDQRTGRRPVRPRIMC